MRKRNAPAGAEVPAQGELFRNAGAGTSVPVLTPTRKWTDAQLRGIRTVGHSLLVSAAAGSGKTAVLAERCAYLVCDAPEPCDVDELLVVTFTEAAAAEMKSRIGKALRDRARANPSPRLTRQLALLDRASISTLHGFCARLLRQHFHLVGLDPAFNVLDADDARLLRTDVVRQLFADRYELDDAGEFQRLVDAYADGNDERLARLVLQIHDLLTSLVDPAAWTGRSLQRIAEAADANDLETSELGRELRRFVEDGLTALTTRCDAAIAQVTSLGGFPKYLDLLRDLRSTLHLWSRRLRENGMDALSDEVALFCPAKLPNVRNDVPNKDAAKSAVEAVRDAMCEGAWRDCLRFKSHEWREGLRSVLPHAKVFVALVEQFEKFYRLKKDAARTVDFADLERFALKALHDPTISPSPLLPLSPSPAARACHRRYRHVLVDEYQDINAVQDAILTLVSKECLRDQPDTETNLFSVGDVKQSIYRFRLAEPTRFLEREKAFRAASLTPSPGTPGEGRGKGPAPSPLAGEGWGEGEVKGVELRNPADRPPAFTPHPNPLPQGERGPDKDLHPNPFPEYREREQDLQTLPGEVISLQSNFRSRAPLLDAINAVFERLMTGPATDVTYDASHRLHPGKTFPSASPGVCTFTGAPIELHLLPKKLDFTGSDESAEPCDDDDADLDRAEREALLVARRIRQLLGHDGGPPTCVMEHAPDGTTRPRPIKYGDIVILLRSMKHKADEYAEVLGAAGIPVHSESSTGYFDSMEVRDLLALLALLDNHRQDVPLAAVLRGPLAGIPGAADAMARIRLAFATSVPIPFHEAARRYSTEKDDDLARHLRDFYAKLAKWRSLAQRRPLTDLLATVYDDTGCLAYAGGLHNGRQRVANLLYLRERAAQFGSFHRQGLSRFLQFLDTLREESDLGQPSVASEAQDVVRIMSVHRSKGLEFPVVFLPDLGKAINLQDCSGNVLADRVAGLGMVVVDETKKVRYPSLASLLVQNRLKQQALAEEMRVLYVAMTRAQEHLVLIGTAAEEAPARWAARWGEHAGPLPTDVLLGATTMLDWVGPVAAVARTADGVPAFDLTAHSPGDVAAWRHPARGRPTSDEQAQRLARLEPLDPPPDPHPLADAVARRLTTTYPYAPFTTTAAARAAGESSAPRIRPAALKKSVLLETESALGPDAIGAATHLVLQHVDLSGPCDRGALAARVGQLVDLRLLTQASAAQVDLDAIGWFLETDLGQLLRRHAADVRRELPIYAAVPPDGTDAPGDPADQVMLRGRIDVLLPLPDRSIVIDYKTGPADAPSDSHRRQLGAYAAAVEQMTGKPASARIVFLRARAIHDL